MLANLISKDFLWSEYIIKKKSTRQIGIELGVANTTISRLLRHNNISKTDRYPQNLTQKQTSCIYGALLGDSDAVYRGGEAFIKFLQCAKQKEYLKFKFDLLQEFTNYSKPTELSRGDFKFNTISHKIFTPFFHQFYPNGKKVVTQEILDNIDEFALAIWYMDDGGLGWQKYKKKNGKTSRYLAQVNLATHCFSEEENYLIRNWFYKRWNIAASIIGGKYYSLSFYGKENINGFLSIVEPHIIPSMAYKVGK